MLGLPESVSVKKIIPKKHLYTQGSVSSAEQKEIDLYIKQISVVGEISDRTIPALDTDDEFKAIFFVAVQLKNYECPDKIAEKLFKLIKQKFVLILNYENKLQLIMHYGKLRKSIVKDSSEWNLKITGLSVRQVWENLLSQITEITVVQGQNIAEAVNIADRKLKLTKEIAAIEKKMGAEKQPKKKLELRKQLKQLERELECL